MQVGNTVSRQSSRCAARCLPPMNPAPGRHRPGGACVRRGYHYPVPVAARVKERGQVEFSARASSLLSSPGIHRAEVNLTPFSSLLPHTLSKKARSPDRFSPSPEFRARRSEPKAPTPDRISSIPELRVRRPEQKAPASDIFSSTSELEARRAEQKAPAVDLFAPPTLKPGSGPRGSTRSSRRIPYP